LAFGKSACTLEVSFCQIVAVVAVVAVVGLSLASPLHVGPARIVGRTKRFASGSKTAQNFAKAGPPGVNVIKPFSFVTVDEAK
jgi:hypothetical protein